MDEPEAKPEVVKKLEDRKTHLEEVKDSYLRAQDALPYLQQNIDLTDWQLRAYKNAPPEASEIPDSQTAEQLESENGYIRGLYQVAQVPSSLQLQSSTSVTTSGTISVFNRAARIQDLGTPLARAYGSVVIAEYQTLQQAQNRPSQVRALLSSIHSASILQRFDVAYEAYQGFRAGSVKRTAACNELRNLLHGLKGDLWTMARKWPKENMNWGIMAARLAINGGGGTEHMFLSRQERVHESLLSRLADVLKDREGGSATNLDSIWTEILDHLYTILGLVA